MRTSVTIQDIRNLISRSKNSTAFSNKLDLKDVASNFREFLEMFEIVYLRVDKIEDLKKENKELKSDIKKLRHDLHDVKVSIQSISRALNEK